jgi:hypothetical protein
MSASLLRLMIFPSIGAACEAIAFYMRAGKLILKVRVGSAAYYCGGAGIWI